MSDSKYGRIFTEQDVLDFVQSTLQAYFGENARIDHEAVKGRLAQFEGRFPQDEPIFVLRGQDRKALAGIRAYNLACTPETSPMEHLEAITNAIDLFERFRIDNPDRMKHPD